MNPSDILPVISEHSPGELSLDVAQLPSHIWIRICTKDQIQQKLRLSLTEHCNFRCFFCHNEGQGPIQRVSTRSLTVAELCTIARAAIAEGVTRIKLTGGEPLLYRSSGDDVASLIRRLAELRSDRASFDLSLTTNGSMLPEYAARLKDAGLDRVTVSLTTINAQTFTSLIAPNASLLTRSTAGLMAARAAGLIPLKMNAVIYQSTRKDLGNLAELRDLLDVALDHGVSEFRIFTLLWHEDFPQFSEFYQFFSPRMRAELKNVLSYFGVQSPGETVEILASLSTSFSNRIYPKLEFGVDLGAMKLGFEAMQFGRLTQEAGFQEGPYAIRVAADGALRSTLTRSPSYDVIDAVRQGAPQARIRSLYRKELEEMP